MNIIEALKSDEFYVALQTMGNKGRWMYWNNISGHWMVKEGRRGGSQILAQTRSEEEAIRVLLGLPILKDEVDPSPASHSQISGGEK